jgi:hypothetical protein
MTNKGYFAAGLLTMAALGGTFVLVKDIHRTSGDDDRVIVAGGSLTIGSQYGWVKDTSFVANHKHKRRTVTGGVILYNDGGPRYQNWSGGPIEFEIAYCNGTCSNVNIPDDKVTIKTDADAKHLRVFNTNQDHKLGDEADAAAAAGSTSFDHQPDWKVNRIRDVVNHIDYKCDNGKCSVFPLYHCGLFGNCQ